jgi:hypothetical protein
MEGLNYLRLFSRLKLSIYLGKTLKVRIWLVLLKSFVDRLWWIFWANMAANLKEVIKMALQKLKSKSREGMIVMKTTSKTQKRANLMRTMMKFVDKRNCKRKPCKMMVLQPSSTW